MTHAVLKGLSVLGLATLVASGAGAIASEGGPAIEPQSWTFAGVRGHFDRAQLQRGFQIYREVCSTCHSLNRISFRNLSEKGGPEFSEAQVEALAETYKITDGPDDNGKMFKRPGRPSDRFPGPYANEKEARSVNHGALPPDFSLLAKARKVEVERPFYMVPWSMLKEVFLSGGYQEGGPDYIYGVLMGYHDKAPPYKDVAGHMVPMTEEDAKADPNLPRCASLGEAEPGKPETCNKMADGMYYDDAFPGHQIAMPPPGIGDGMVKYKDGIPGTHAQYAHDVASFMAWAADPKLEERKRLGLAVMLYLAVTAALLFIAKQRVWGSEPH